MTAANEPVAPVGPYRPLVRAAGFLVCSGQLGLRDGVLVDGGVTAELDQAVANLSRVLASAGAGLADVVKTTVYLLDMAEFETMNAAYLQLFAEPRPARTCIAVVGIPRGAHVEIEAWALDPAGPAPTAG